MFSRMKRCISWSYMSTQKKSSRSEKVKTNKRASVVAPKSLQSLYGPRAYEYTWRARVCADSLSWMPVSQGVGENGSRMSEKKPGGRKIERSKRWRIKREERQKYILATRVALCIRWRPKRNSTPPTLYYLCRDIFYKRFADAAGPQALTKERKER